MKTYTIGRKNGGCDIQFAEEAVSASHAILKLSDDGRIQLIDAGSTNFTFLKDAHSDKWKKITQEYLYKGDRVRFGTREINVEDLLDRAQSRAAAVHDVNYSSGQDYGRKAELTNFLDAQQPSSFDMPKALIAVVALIFFSGAGLFYYVQNTKFQQVRAGIFAQETSEANRKRHLALVHTYSKNASIKIVNNSYLGGDNINYDILSWKYDEYKREYLIDLKITWKGTLTARQYQVNGQLRIIGDTVDFVPSYYNQNLEDFIGVKNMVIGATVIVGTLAEISK